MSIERMEVLLLIAAVVAMLVRRIRLPYTVGLVVTGIALALSRMAPNVPLTKELVFTAFLPPLIFEAAVNIPWKELRRDLPVVLVLATLGVVLSAGVTAVGMRWLIGWEWAAAILFGVLIAATDPVSVIATFKEVRVHGRLKLLVEAESLLNDGTAAVIFTVALAAIQGGTMNGAGIAQSFLTTIVGGVLCGALVGWGALLLSGRTDDHLVEITFTTVAAYGSFLLAEHFHLSGVLATLTTGLIVGNVGSLGALTDKGRDAVLAFWEYIAFAANSLVFLLLGIQEAHVNFVRIIVPSLAAVGLVLLGRTIAVYGSCALFRFSSLKVKNHHQSVLVWGGLRGALALALALGLPANTPQRNAITTAAFAVVAFSVIVQGLTMSPLLKMLGIIETAAPAKGEEV